MTLQCIRKRMVRFQKLTRNRSLVKLLKPRHSFVYTLYFQSARSNTKVHMSCTQNKTNHMKYKHCTLQLLDRHYCYRFIRSSLNRFTSVMLLKASELCCTVKFAKVINITHQYTEVRDAVRCWWRSHS